MRDHDAGFDVDFVFARIAPHVARGSVEQPPTTILFSVGVTVDYRATIL